MDIQVQSGATGYKGLVPAFVLDGTSPYIKDLSATFKVTDVFDTRTVQAETTALVSLAGQSSKKHLSVIFYLCSPLLDKADKLLDGTVVYSATGYPDIIKGDTYTITGILQPGWQGMPLIYVPTVYDFKKSAGDESFFYGTSDRFKQEPSSMAAKQIIEEYFRYWNARNITEMEQRMTPDRKGIDWGFDAIDYVKLTEVNERYSREGPDTKVFNVVFEIKYKKGKSTPINEGKIQWGYFLKRNDANSPLLIYDWGRGGGYDW